MQPESVNQLCPSPSKAGFPDRWISAFRKFVIATVIFHLAVFLVAIPFSYESTLEEIREENYYERLDSAGISAEFFAAYNTGQVAVIGALFTLLGVIILFRRANTFMPLFVSLVLVIEGTQLSGLFYSLELLHSAGRWFAEVADAISSSLFVIFFLIFPSGRFVPAWTRWFAVLVVLGTFTGVALAIANPSAGPLDELVIPTLTLLFIFFVVMIYAQVYRYRWVCTPVERQQVKWLVVGLVVALALFTSAVIATVANPDRGPIAIMFWFTVANLGFLMIPLAITIAILRYRLFDIDRLINRTLVYGILTAILAVTYFACVFVLQRGLGEIAGSSGLAVALSTLMAGSLFRPLRTRVQRSVDRRFYRTRYDAAELLRKFSQTVRDEVDLDRLEQLLSITINDAMRPDQISLWLYDPKPAVAQREHTGDAGT